MNKFLDTAGLKHYDAKIKAIAGGSLSISGQTLSMMSVSGASLGSVEIPLVTYDVASGVASGLMSSVHFKKLEGIAAGATKVEASGNNGNIKIGGTETTVYTHPSATAHKSGMYKITVDAMGHISAATAVAKSDITSLGIPGQDTTYTVASTNKNGLMSSAHYNKIEGIAVGAQVNVIEKVSVNNTPLTVNSKGVNIDLSAYALKQDVSTAVLYCGSVDTFALLPKDAKQGAMYNVASDGMNYVWTGTEWDAQAPTFKIDPISNTEIDKMF